MERTIKQVINQATNQLGLDGQHPEAAAPSVFVKNFGQFERIGATYTHKIYKPKLNVTTGFSKPANQPEPADKQGLFKHIVRRLAASPKNYLGPGCRIEFYANRSNFDRDSYKICTLYHDRWEPEPCVLTWSWLIQFLNHFYTPTVVGYVQDLSGATPTPAHNPAPVVAPPPSTNKSNSLSMSLRFRSTQELSDYTQALLKDGHAPGMVGDFLVKMLDKHNW